MYTELVKTQDQALCHLFFHCCFGDGDFKEKEMDFVSEIFVMLGLQHTLNIKTETIKYRSYRDNIEDEAAYLEYVVKLINPVNELALYSYCADICLCDSSLDLKEESLLLKIASELKIEKPKEEIIKELMIQRKTVQEEKIF